MAQTLITRTADTDDDGSGATGTVRNNAWKTTTIYDPIDGLFDGTRREIGPLVVQSQERCQLTHSTDTTVTTTGDVTLSWDTEAHDTGGLHAGGSPSRITVPAGGDGRWLIAGHIRFASAAGNNRWVYVLKNGATYVGQASFPVIAAGAPITVPFLAYDPAASATDYYEIVVGTGTNTSVKGGTGVDTSIVSADHLG